MALDSAAQNAPELSRVTSKELIQQGFIDPSSSLVVTFQRALDELAQRHIYQWSTFYRDCMATHLSLFVEKMQHIAPDRVEHALFEPLANHARDIFNRGYHYARKKHSHDDAVKKSMNGLSRFLELPLDFYSARTSNVSGHRAAVALRVVVSAALRGILEGYSTVSLDRHNGSMVLSEFHQQWAHCVAFLVPRHAEAAVSYVEPGSFRHGLEMCVLPLLDGIQRAFDQGSDDYSPMPVAAQYLLSQRRLDITVRPPADSESQRLIEARVFLDETVVSIADLDDAVVQQVKLLVAPLKPDIWTLVKERPSRAAVVVPASGPRVSVASHAYEVWKDAVFAFRNKLTSALPITYNFAREFPLYEPGKARFFHVVRTSVRDLLRTFERRNGVRLWCSVRRSGKTTACLDLETTTGDSTIVSQTCGVAPTAGATKFYVFVREAVRSRRAIADTFVSDIVSGCAPIDVENRRTVFVIDEYETLFGFLDAAVKDDPSVRFNVVQPILNQLMTFSYNNLLVFLGQQPDAHFILMDQNQLAPNVTQDPFPLFEHVSRTTTGEFAVLVRKILAGRIDCTADFLDALFKETAGHPFLTANVLAEFVDWLIEKARRQAGLRVQGGDFVEFANSKLDVDTIMLSPDYEFFRNAASQAMSMKGYRSNRWLFATYWILRQIAVEAPETYSVDWGDFRELMTRIPRPDGGALPHWSDVLRNASQANFLTHDDNEVRVRIRTLGRIAGAVQPALS